MQRRRQQKLEKKLQQFRSKVMSVGESRMSRTTSGLSRLFFFLLFTFAYQKLPENRRFLSCWHKSIRDDDDEKISSFDKIIVRQIWPEF